MCLNGPGQGFRRFCGFTRVFGVFLGFLGIFLGGLGVLGGSSDGFFGFSYGFFGSFLVGLIISYGFFGSFLVGLGVLGWGGGLGVLGGGLPMVFSVLCEGFSCGCRVLQELVVLLGFSLLLFLTIKRK